MSLTISEKYLAQNTMYLYNTILNVDFYSLMWKGKMILPGWDVNNECIAEVFGDWDYDVDDVNELGDLIFETINNDAWQMRNNDYITLYVNKL